MYRSKREIGLVVKITIVGISSGSRSVASGVALGVGKIVLDKIII